LHRKNNVDAKAAVVSTSYRMLGSAAAIFFGAAAAVGPYIKDSVVNDTAEKVEKRLRLAQLDKHLFPSGKKKSIPFGLSIKLGSKS
jgi:hypothetical protein